MTKALLLLSLASLGQVQAPDYPTGRRWAVSAGTPLVVGVGCAAPAGDWNVVNVGALEGFEAPCVVVSRPEGGDLYWVKTLPAAATAKDVGDALKPAVVPAPIIAPPVFAPPAYRNPFWTTPERWGGRSMRSANC